MVKDNWEVGDAYEQYVGRWSTLAGRLFLDWLDLPAGLRWVDVGCGTGALTATIVDRAAPASVIGIEPSEGFIAAARERLGESAQLLRGAADALPLEDGEADVVVSGLVLNFIPDLHGALSEMRRVAPTVGAYVWDYAKDMRFMRIFWDAAVALDRSARDLDEAVRFPVATEAGLRAAFAGFDDVETTALDVPTHFPDFDAFWSPFLQAQGPAPSYLASLDTAARARMRDAVQERTPASADGSIELIARAWAVRGRA